VFGPPKNGKAREFAVSPFLRDMLAEHLSSRPVDPEALVFPGPRGGPMRWGNFRERHFHRTVEEVLPEDFAGMRLHDLRHTYAALLIAAGVHAKAIQEQLGHSSIVVTMDVYGSLFPDEAERVANAMEETYQRAAASGSIEGTVRPIR
jgi:integrase